MGWQPIETAPKTKTVLLFAVIDVAEDGTVRNWEMGTGHWDTNFEGDDKHGSSPWCWEGRQLRPWDIAPTHWMPLPTHWMPLPDPPKGTPDGE